MSSASANKPINGEGKRKRRCNRKADRLSNLPIEILGSILSRLGTVEAVRASLLSSKWKELWRKAATKLVFCQRPIWVPPGSRQLLDRYSADRHRNAFVGYVNRVLRLHRETPALDEFGISFGLGSSVSDALDAWLRFAFRKGVRRLELNLLRKPDLLRSDACPAYSFPAMGELSSFAGLHNLKDLCLQGVNLERGFECLLSTCCPLLERLSIKYVGSLHLKLVGSSRLSFLEIYCPCVLRHFFNVEITSTNLLQLKYYAPHSTLCVKTNHLLSELKLYGTHVESFFRSSFHDSFDYVLQVDKLMLGMPHKSFGGPIGMPLRFPQFNKLVQLELIMDEFLDPPLWPFAIIEVAPLLHRFAVKFTDGFCYDETLPLGDVQPLFSQDVFTDELGDVLPPFSQVLHTSLKKAKEAKEFSHDHLKVVEVSGFRGTFVQVEFVERLLKIGKSLEKVIINFVKCEEEDPMYGGYAGDNFSNSFNILRHYCLEERRKRVNEVACSLEKRLPFGAKLSVVYD